MQEEMLHSITPSNPTIPQRRVAIADPDSGSGSASNCLRTGEQEAVADPLEIWRMLPALKDLPEAMLRQLP
jgi:hypothetical protein